MRHFLERIAGEESTSAFLYLTDEGEIMSEHLEYKYKRPFPWATLIVGISVLAIYTLVGTLIYLMFRTGNRLLSGLQTSMA